MQPLTAESREVYYTSAPLATAGDEELAFLKARAAENPRRRCRLCLHPSAAAAQHEMLIVHHRETYVPPHRHERKAESLLVVEGEALAYVFEDGGRVRERIHLGPPGSGGRFSYYMPAGVWHGLVIQSEWFVFVEATAGPFEAAGMAIPDWAADAYALEA